MDKFHILRLWQLIPRINNSTTAKLMFLLIFVKTTAHISFQMIISFCYPDFGAIGFYFKRLSLRNFLLFLSSLNPQVHTNLICTALLPTLLFKATDIRQGMNNKNFHYLLILHLTNALNFRCCLASWHPSLPLIFHPP